MAEARSTWPAGDDVRAGERGRGHAGSSCKQNTHVRVRRVLPESATLPPILVVNAGVRTRAMVSRVIELDKMDGKEVDG
jgi:hypothetical protein